MKLNDLQPREGSRQNTKRVGRGIGSGKGKTCGVGQKGQKARSGVAIKGFEGGQMPLYKRLPKRGFTNNFAKKYATVSLARVQEAIEAKKIDASKTIDEAVLAAAKVIKAKKDGVKLLGNGTLKTKVTFNVAKATKSAIESVEKSGGKVDIIAVKEYPNKKEGKKTERRKAAIEKAAKINK